MTRLLGIIGHPLKHSLSPVFQQAALDHCGFDIRYEAWDVERGDLAAAVSRLRSDPYLGANVTVPYKEVVLPMMDEVETVASSIGAVNTIVRRGTDLVGHNTDVTGFIRALRGDASFDTVGKRVVVLGAGGAARAVCFALIEGGVRSVVIANRDPARAQALVRSLKGTFEGLQVSAVAWQSEEMYESVRRSELIVNCTTLGMKHSAGELDSPLARDRIPAGTLVFDLVYNPQETPLLRMARQAGARTLPGVAMLVYQGAASFEIWTGVEAPIAVMMEAVREALSGTQ